MRRALATLRRISVALLRAVVAAIGVDEVMLTLALVLLAIGAHQVWPPAAYLAPAAVLLWVFLPQRKTFIYRSSKDQG